MSLRILGIKNDCTGCGACVSSCPKSALKLSYDDEGFYYPQVNVDMCIGCDICGKSCHVLNSCLPQTPEVKYKAYMLKAKNEEIVKNSSSGGCFTLLANYIIKEGGVVYGAKYDFNKEKLVHTSTDYCSLQDLRKSKYIESYMGNTMNDVKINLIKGRKVLFCGTPCQVEGLSYYLKTWKVDTTNLLLVRFVCHGVPSNKFFTEYKHYEEKKHHSILTSFDFRPKTRGWRSSDWKMTFDNGTIETGPYYYYYYYYYYYFQLSNLLRRSCYSCKRVFHEIADFTIGDFWGIHYYRPNYDEQGGLSLVLIHSDKAMALLKKIEHECIIDEIPSSAVQYIYREAEGREGILSERDGIFDEVKNKGYMKVVKKKLKKIIWKRKTRDTIVSKLRPILKHIKRQ